MVWVEIQVYPEYIQRRDFGSALANLLYFEGDHSMSERVAHNFIRHPFVFGDGMMRTLLCTRVVSDLTNNEYRATFKYRNITLGSEDSLRRDLGPHADDAIRAVEEEKSAARLIGGLEQFTYTGSGLLLQAHSSGICHWLIDCDDGTIIDRGEIRRIVDRDYFLSTIQAVLQI